MKIRGDISLRGDKSISHRALIIASICTGRSFIRNLPNSNDVESTARCLQETGIEFSVTDRTTEIKGGTFTSPHRGLNCRNSGTTLRLLAGLYSSLKIPVQLIGDSSLNRRPMDRIIAPLSKMGVDIESNESRSPIRLKGFNLKPVHYEIDVPSAQVKSCLLLAALGEC